MNGMDLALIIIGGLFSLFVVFFLLGCLVCKIIKKDWTDYNFCQICVLAISFLGIIFLVFLGGPYASYDRQRRESYKPNEFNTKEYAVDYKVNDTDTVYILTKIK